MSRPSFSATVIHSAMAPNTAQCLVRRLAAACAAWKLFDRRRPGLALLLPVAHDREVVGESDVAPDGAAGVLLGLTHLLFTGQFEGGRRLAPSRRRRSGRSGRSSLTSIVRPAKASTTARSTAACPLLTVYAYPISARSLARARRVSRETWIWEMPTSPAILDWLQPSKKPRWSSRRSRSSRTRKLQRARGSVFAELVALLQHAVLLEPALHVLDELGGTRSERRIELLETAGILTGHARSRRWRLISPSIVGIANVARSTPRSTWNRSIALISPIEPTWTRSSSCSPRPTWRLASLRTSGRYCRIRRSRASVSPRLWYAWSSFRAASRRAAALAAPRRRRSAARRCGETGVGPGRGEGRPTEAGSDHSACRAPVFAAHFDDHNLTPPVTRF